MLTICLIFGALVLHLGLVQCHTGKRIVSFLKDCFADSALVITYPPWRGDNLITNGTLPEHDIHALGQNYVDGQYTFPYG